MFSRCGFELQQRANIKMEKIPYGRCEALPQGRTFPAACCQARGHLTNPLTRRGIMKAGIVFTGSGPMVIMKSSLTKNRMGWFK